MTCSKVPPLLSRYLDSELLPRETAEVEGHMAQCESCRALLQNWRLQGSHLRSHLRRHPLGDEFVQRVVVNASAQKAGGRRPEAAELPKRNLLHWLPAAAAILAVIFVTSQFAPNKGGIGFARVIDPGESLEVLAMNSSVWMRGAAGELLRSGDWLRNPVPGAAEILWRDACRLTLEPGTLAHIQAGSTPAGDQLVLLRGALHSEVENGGADLQVRTPAGSVSGAGGSFDVRVVDFAFGHLEIAAGGSELMTGTVVPIGEVSIKSGVARLQTSMATRDLPAGDNVVFTGEDFARTPSRPDQAVADLRILSGTPARGALSSSLTAAGEGLRIDLTAENVSLKRLLESATGIEIRGGESLTVEGSLRFPVGSSAQIIASAVGDALELPISYRQEKAQRMLTAKSLSQKPALDWTRGEFRFETSPDGTISFSLRAVPAGRALQILRSVVPDLPQLAEDSVWIPVTLQASGLSPADAAERIKSAIGLEIAAGDSLAGVLEIETPAAAPRDGSGPGGASPASKPHVSPSKGQDAAGARAGIDDPYPPAGAPGSVAPVAAEATASSGHRNPARPRTLWEILNGATSVPPLDWFAGTAGVGRSVARGKASPKAQEFFGPAGMIPAPMLTRHLVWPALSIEEASGGEPDYLLTNPMGLAARTLWSGFDREGRLVAQYSMVVPGSSTLDVSPWMDLPTSIGEGGHWETASDKQLAGSREGGSGGGLVLGLAVEAERLRVRWSYPAAWLSLGGSFWVVNPGKEPSTVVAAILRKGQILHAETLIVPPQGGMLWPGTQSALRNLPSSLASGASVIVHSLNGSLATGLAK